jgi:hypothetical protein
MFYFHLLALCILSCGMACLVVSVTPNLRCGKFLLAELQELVRQDCAHASMALFSKLPCVPSEIQTERLFSTPRAYEGVGYKLPMVSTYGGCSVYLEVRALSGQAITTIEQLSEDLVYLYEQCLGVRGRDGGFLQSNGLFIQIKHMPPVSRPKLDETPKGVPSSRSVSSLATINTFK